MPKSQLRPNPHPAPGYARRAALRARPTMLSMGGGYSAKVLAAGPFAYWPLWETSGSDAQCLVNPAQNGTAVGVTWADTLGPDGVNGAPFFDGANDYVNINVAAFKAAFDPDEHTIMIWGRVNAVGTWTDAVLRRAVLLNRDGNNNTALWKSNAANRLTWTSIWGGAGGSRNRDGMVETGWFHLAITRSLTAGVAVAYYNGAQEGASWVTNIAGLAITSAFIGSNDAVPNFPWHGWLAHCAVWNTALTPAQILDLATV